MMPTTTYDSLNNKFQNYNVVAYLCVLSSLLFSFRFHYIRSFSSFTAFLRFTFAFILASFICVLSSHGIGGILGDDVMEVVAWSRTPFFLGSMYSIHSFLRFAAHSFCSFFVSFCVFEPGDHGRWDERCGMLRRAGRCGVC
ncbi:hypothetical protein C8R45DRAFT_907183 [Mycena sanguinolenta]|nr:hypothetical protein C8R45DRAFT_907183 [Mycena sanguinolenta]